MNKKTITAVIRNENRAILLEYITLIVWKVLPG